MKGIICGQQEQTRPCRRRSGIRAALAVLAAGILAAPVPSALAATFVVTSAVDAVDDIPGDGICATVDGDCTLRAAVMEANALAGNDTVRIAVTGTIALTRAGSGEDGAVNGDLDVTGTVYVLGESHQLTILSGNNLDRVFDVRPGGYLHLSGLKIVKGKVADNGGCIRAEGPVILYRVAIEKCVADSGGAIGSTHPAFVQLEESILKGNKAILGNGGAINATGSVYVENSILKTNQASNYGGGIFATDPGPYSNIYVENSALIGNTAGASAQGGGIAVFTDDFEMYRSIVKGNKAGYGAGLAFGTGAIQDVTVEGNAAAQLGGGILLGGTATVRRSAILKNKAPKGAGIYVSALSPSIENSIIARNVASERGGGVENGGATPVFDNVTMAGNTAASGSAIYSGTALTTTVRNSIIVGAGTNCDVAVATLGAPNLDSGSSCAVSISTAIAGLGPLTYGLKGLEAVIVPKLDPPFYPLRSDSIAVDAGDNGTCVGSEDIRYGTRLVDGDGDATVTCDLGAFELGGGLY